MENLSLLTYTHSSASDVHPAYFGRISKFFPSMKNIYVACDTNIDYGICSVYNDSESYTKHMLDTLEKIDTDYVIYSQEDYILFDEVKSDDLQRFIDYMDSDKDISFIRLIHSGLGDGSKKYNDDLYYIDTNSEYFFSTQATIWRKDVLIGLFTISDVETIFDEPKNTPFLKGITDTGLYTTRRGKAVGGHFNSYHYPYIATAIVKGKWNLSEYQRELDSVFAEYGIMPFERGIR